MMLFCTGRRWSYMMYHGTSLTSTLALCDQNIITKYEGGKHNKDDNKPFSFLTDRQTDRYRDRRPNRQKDTDML